MLYCICVDLDRNLLASQTCRPVDLVEPCGAAASSSASQPAVTITFSGGRGGIEPEGKNVTSISVTSRGGGGPRPKVTDVTKTF